MANETKALPLGAKCFRWRRELIWYGLFSGAACLIVVAGLVAAPYFKVGRAFAQSDSNEKLVVVCLGLFTAMGALSAFLTSWCASKSRLIFLPDAVRQDGVGRGQAGNCCEDPRVPSDAGAPTGSATGTSQSGWPVGRQHQLRSKGSARSLRGDTGDISRRASSTPNSKESSAGGKSAIRTRPQSLGLPRWHHRLARIGVVRLFESRDARLEVGRRTGQAG